MTVRTFTQLALMAALAAAGCMRATEAPSAATAEATNSTEGVATRSPPSGDVPSDTAPVTDRPACAELAAPLRLQAGGEFIDTQVGHAAPYLADFDGDGVRDLLVGQFGEGKLKIHRNNGTDALPEYDAPAFFQAGGDVARVPAG